jgi:hypothetical protein
MTEKLTWNQKHAGSMLFRGLLVYLATKIEATTQKNHAIMNTVAEKVD